MNVPAQLIQFELTDLQPTFADYIQSQKDENTRKFNIQFLFERNILSLSGCTATATVTIDNVLIDQELACTVDDTNNYVTVVVDAPYSGVMAVQVTLASGNDILTMPRPLYIRVTQDIAETAQIDDNTHGSFAEVVHEIAEARGTYTTLHDAIAAKLDNADGSVKENNIADESITVEKVADDLAVVINAKEEKSNKKTTLTGNESSNDYYPTTKAVVGYVAESLEEVGELKSTLDEIWIHTKCTNSSGAGSQKNVQISGKSGQTLRIVTDAATVNLNTRATETGSNIQTQFVAANRVYNLAITTDFDWIHLYYTANGTTNFYIVDTVLTKAVDDITDIKEDISALETEDTKFHAEIDNHESIINANVMGIDVQENLYPGAADWSGTWLNSDPAHVAVSNEKYMGYPTVYSSQSWRRFAKNIPVIAGKTYTFEGWIKQSVAGSVIAYIVTDEFTTDKATVSQNSKQLNDQPANTWIKVSLTFACTGSGNVSPHILGMHGDFYVAKYLLVEGDTVFSLYESLKDKATKQETSGIGDYQKYSFSGGNGGQYWNPEIQKVIPPGTKIRLIFDSYSGTKLSYVRIDGKKSDNSYTNNICRISSPVHGGSADGITTENYVGLRVQFARTETEANVTASILLATSVNLGITYDLLGMNIQRVFHVEKDGTGDFTSFVEAINTACQFMDSIVYVGAGTYDLLDELGTNYIKQAGVGERKGLELKNRVHVICSSQTILSMSNLRSLYDSDEQYDRAKEYLSPINTGVYGCTLENATIIDSNVRYSIHDDQGWSGSTPYTNKFINCTLVHKSGMYGDCIGGGLGENCDIEIRGCYLEGESNVVRLAYYHGNNHTGVTTAKGRVTICDNYFAGVGTFQMTNYGDSTETSTAYVSNNSFGTAPSVRNAGTTVDMKAWNNEIRTTNSN